MLLASRRCSAFAVAGRRALAGAAAGPLRKTPLWDNHVALGGKMVEFGGWDMPVQYPDGIVKSHEHTRAAAGLFDVSHMLGCVVRGADRVAFMEKLCTADLAALPEGMGSLTVITNEEVPPLATLPPRLLSFSSASLPTSLSPSLRQPRCDQTLVAGRRDRRLHRHQRG